MNTDSFGSKVLVGVVSSVLTLAVVAIVSVLGNGLLVKALGGITHAELRSGITVQIYRPETNDVMSCNGNPNEPISLKAQGNSTFQRWVLKQPSK